MNRLQPVLGIDPGITGAIALVSGRFAAVWDMPAHDGQVNAHALAELIHTLQNAHDLAEVILEKVNAMPPRKENGIQRRAGTQSSFNFGQSTGIVKGVVCALGLTLREVTPQAWKKAAGLIGQPKDASRIIAQRLYPTQPLHRKKDHGRADALLIAHFGRWL